MAGRAQAFSDDTVIALTGQHFIPVAENCSPLQRQKDAKGDFFRLVAEQGHYAGRTYPTGTRQGYYALTADGTVLAANSRDPQRMTELLQTALQRWRPAHGRWRSGAQGQMPAAYEPANPDRYPADGLVLRLTARDLPARRTPARTTGARTPGTWTTPGSRGRRLRDRSGRAGRGEGEAGGAGAVLRRLARFHLRDFVRGEPSVWPAEALREGSLGGGCRRVRAAGPATALRCGASGVGGALGASREPGAAQLGYGVRREAGGEAEWDAGAGRFTRFDLLASGPAGAPISTTTARTTWDRPPGDRVPAAGSEPRDRTPPHTIYHREYFGDGGGRGERAGGAGGSGWEGLPDPPGAPPDPVRHAHSQVDPQRDPHTWGLTERGRRDAGRLAALALFDHASGYYAGAEPKMEQTLAPVAAAHGMTVQPEAALGETGSKGWLAEEGQFKAVVRRFFDHPRRPRPRVGDAREATERFQGAVERLLTRHPVVVHPGHALPGTVAIASGGRMLCAYLAHALGLDARRPSPSGARCGCRTCGAGAGAGRTAFLVVPFGTIAY